jgi:hypothetical protein
MPVVDLFTLKIVTFVHRLYFCVFFVDLKTNKQRFPYTTLTDNLWGASVFTARYDLFFKSNLGSFSSSQAVQWLIPLVNHPFAAQM